MDFQHVKRPLYIALLTVCAIAVIGGVLHSPIDVLSGATPKSAAKSATKLTGTYILHLHTTTAPWTDEATRQAFAATMTRSDAKAPTLRGQTLQLAIPSGDEPLATFAASWQKRLAAQGITLDVTTMDTVRLRSRLVAGKYTATLGPDDLVTPSQVTDDAATTAASYEMR